jgi:hypothetical protein
LTEGVPPFSYKTCDMRIWPRGSADCRVWIVCGSLRVYGSATSWAKCGGTGDGGTNEPTFVADPDPTPQDGDAQLHVDLTANTATLSDINLASESYAVTFRLEPTTAAVPTIVSAFDSATFNLNVTSNHL